MNSVRGARSSGRWVGLGLGILGAALLAVSAIHVYRFVDALVSRAPVIVWDETGWITLPAALALLALALCLYIGRTQGPEADGPRSDAVKRLLALAACLLPFVIVLPLGAQWMFGRHLEAQGYSECIAGVWVAADHVPEVAETPAPCRGLSG